MALINCPECKKEISSLAKNCPNCGFNLEVKTVIRLELHLSIENNIFDINVYGFCGEDLIAEARQSLCAMRGILTIEMTFYGYIDCLQFVFTEHLKNKTYNFNLDTGSNKRNIGLRLTETRNPHDEPTYVSSYDELLGRLDIMYLHPDIEFEPIDFYSIRPKHFPKVTYK